MSKKRILAMLLGAALALTVVMSVMPSLSFKAEAKTDITVPARNPAILADVGEKIDFADYSVEIGAAVVPASSLTWSRDGAQVTNFTPDKKGVTKFVAKSGSSEKTVYVVAKESSESEYVLYENDFSCTKQDLLDEGWVFFHTDKKYTETSATVSDSQLHLGSKSDGYARAILPTFIGDFSGYAVEAVATQTDCTDGARWCSIVYHCKDNVKDGNNWYYPYYHMCVRNNTTSNTIEFAERTTSDAWNVITTVSKKMTMVQPHTLRIECYDNVVQYLFDNENVFITSNAGAHDTGYAGLTSNYGVANFDNVKVTLLLEKPERPPEKPQLIDTSVNRTESNILNYVSNHAYVKFEELSSKKADLTGSSRPVAVLVGQKDGGMTKDEIESILKQCADANMIPEFRMTAKTEVDALNSALQSSGVPEAVVVGNAEIVKYARTKDKTAIRGVLDKTDLKSVRSVFDLYIEAAGAYAQAVLLPDYLATKQNVAELQEYELAVWAFQENPETDTELAWLLTSGANAVVSGNWAGINEAQKTLIKETNAVTRTPVWTAHRGNFVTYPENSLSAYRSALENGADCIETDVYLTKDGEVVILHDGTLDRTSNGTGNVANLTLAEIQKFKLKNTNGTLSDETFPTFRELLELCKGKDIKILCEIKSGEANLTKKTSDLIKEFKMEKQVVYISFNATQLLNAKKYMDVTTGYLLSAPDGIDPSDTVGTLNSYYKQQNNCLNYHSTMAINFGNITPEFLRDANDRGVTLWSWTYDSGTASSVCANFLAGMNGMTTNKIAYLNNTVKTLLPNQNRIHLRSNGTASLTVSAETYLRKKMDVTKDTKTNVMILDNDGVISYENGKITALKDGTASIMFSYQTNLPNGSKYTLYTQPVLVYVNVADPHQEFALGDVNGDGKVNASDYQLLKRIILKTAEATDDIRGRCDITGDGSVRSNDYLMLKRIVLKTI